MQYQVSHRGTEAEMIIEAESPEAAVETFRRRHGEIQTSHPYVALLVELVDEDTEEEVRYRIVGEYEADVRSGLVSINSPIARALIGKRVGDSVDVNTPGGGRCYEILKIEFV